MAFLPSQKAVTIHYYCHSYNFIVLTIASPQLCTQTTEDVAHQQSPHTVFSADLFLPPEQPPPISSFPNSWQPSFGFVGCFSLRCCKWFCRKRKRKRKDCVLGDFLTSQGILWYLIYIVTCFLLWSWIAFQWTYMPCLVVYSCNNGYLGWLHVLAILK